jgi:type I restriction enzyme S subunit
MRKSYEKYKISNLEWIGPVPQHWKVGAVKHCFKFKVGFTPPTSNDDFYDHENGFDWVTISDIDRKYIFESKNKISKKAIDVYSKEIVPAGSLLYSFKLSVGKVAFAGKDIFTNEAIFSILPDDNLELSYYYYCLPTILIHNANENIYGAKIFNQEVIKNSRLPIPPKEEQTKIAQYLDTQTATIDQLIQQKEKLIELLNEKRRAVINEAVTKGLNPNAKMKDSGIEWLGEIPDHWELRNMEIVARKDRYSITGGPFGSDLKNEEYTEEGVRIIQLQNIGVGEFRDDYKIYTSEEKADYLFSSNIFPGEIIIAKMADPVARACIVPNTASRFIMASDGIRLEIDKEKYNTKYIEYSINARYFNYQAELNSTGTTRLRIGLTTLKKLKLLLPSLKEQNEIVEYLETYNQYFLETSEKLDNQIEKLKEYRQSIISEAVTGKIDVTDWQPNKQQVA